MKICHITSVHPRYDIRICEKECVSLAKAGYDTYLVVNDNGEDVDYKGVHILSTRFKDKGRIQRIISAPGRVLKKAIDIDADIYHLHDPELLLISDKLIKAGKKVIFDAHEDTEKQIESKYWIPSFIRKAISLSYRWYSHNKLRRVAGIISVTPSIVDKLKRYNSNTIMIANYPIIENKVKKKDNNDLYVGKYIFFAGGISEQWCHDVVVRAVDIIGNIFYLIAGREYGAYLQKLKLVGKNYDYLGVISHNKVMEYYRNALAGIVILSSDTQVGKEGTLGNTKLFEVMESGRPLICSDLKLWREIVEKHKCGICVDSQDISTIIDAIRFIINNPYEGNKMGENGKKAVMKEYNWGTQEKVLYDFYESIC